MSTADPPLELRVHGVGGPQARKMLGLLHEEDVLTLPPFVDTDGRAVPGDAETRFTRRVPDDRTEAYEWGALTTGTWRKALWVVYLPFTVINAGGWAHSPPAEADRPGFPVRSHLALTHLAAVLATATYVMWVGYVTLELVGVRWREHALAGGASGWERAFVEDWVPGLSVVAFVGLLGLLGAIVARRGRFEQVGQSTATPWPAVPEIADAEFFARAPAQRRLMWWHLGLGAIVAAGLVAVRLASVHRIGTLIFVVVGIQLVVLSALAVAESIGRTRRSTDNSPGDSPSSEDPTAPGVWVGPAAVPLGAAFAVLGTAMAHAAFAGAASLLRSALSRWPGSSGEVEVGAELGASAILGWTLLIVVVGVALVAAFVAPLRRSDQVGLSVKLARRTKLLAAVVLVAVAVPVVWFLVANALDNGPWTDPWTYLTHWYDTYLERGQAVPRQIGAAALVALPAMVFLVLRGDYDTGPARPVGDVWDVLTFWPRRFHPLGAPASAERAVPELRARIAATRRDLGGVVVVGHSQGSVLAVAALGAEGPADGAGPTRLVTIGSPLGTLYTPTWPAYVPALLRAVASQHDLEWWNYWRGTDPIGAGVPFAHNQRCPDPTCPGHQVLDGADGLPPGERPVPWGRRAGHGQYLSDAGVRARIDRCRAALARS